MKLTHSHSRRRRTHQLGGVAMGTVLWTAVVLLLLTLVGLGYALWRISGETNQLKVAAAQATNELFRVQTEAIKNQAAATNAAIEVSKAAQGARLAIAKARRDDFVARAKGVTNQIHEVLDRMPSLQADLESLRDGPAGQRAAAHPELVTAARGLFDKDVRKLPKDFDANQRLESARRLLFQVAQSERTEFEPDAAMNAALDDIRKWAEVVANTQNDVAASVSYIKNEAQNIRIETATSNPYKTLQAAMSAQSAAFQAGINKQTTAISESATAAAIIAQAKAEAERIIAEARRKAKMIQDEIAAADNAYQDEALLREAGTPEVRRILAVVATPGILEADGRPKASGKPGPMSYKALQTAGCLTPGFEGMKRLYSIASNPNDRERPRWERRFGGVFMNFPERREAVSKVHDTLIRLGPYLVKAGVLEP